MSEKIITPAFRGSYVSLFKPTANKKNPDQIPKYKITVALNKKNPEHIKFHKKLTDQIRKAVVDKWGEKRADRIIEIMKNYPLKDGDNQNSEEPTAELEGHWFINATADRRPGLVDKNREDILDEDEAYSGAWYRITGNLYCWEHETGGKGVSLGLHNVQKVKDDEHFSGKTKASDDFDDWDDDSDDDDLLD